MINIIFIIIIILISIIGFSIIRYYWLDIKESKKEIARLEKEILKRGKI